MRTLVCNVEPGARPLAVGAAEQLLRTRAGPSARRTAQLTDSAEGLQVTCIYSTSAPVPWSMQEYIQQDPQRLWSVVGGWWEMHSVIFREQRASGSSLSKYEETWYHHWQCDPKNENF